MRGALPAATTHFSWLGRPKMKRSAVWLSLAVLVSTSTQVWAQSAERADQRGDRIEQRLDRRGDRAENRLDRRGDHVDNRLDRASNRADARGHELAADAPRCARRSRRPPPRSARRDDRPDARPPRSAHRSTHGSPRGSSRLSSTDGVGSECRRRPAGACHVLQRQPNPLPVPRPCRRNAERNASSARWWSLRARRRPSAGGNESRACAGYSATAARWSAGRA